MLYLVDKPLADIAFRTIAGDPDPVVVLIQDGVVLRPGETIRGLADPVYAVERDLAVRGIDSRKDVQPISYDTLIDLVLEHEVKNFV